MTHGEVALGVGPAAAPPAPVAARPSFGIALPGRVGAVSDHLEPGAVAPDRAGQIGIGRGDDDLAAFAILRPPPGCPVLARADIGRLGGRRRRRRVRILHPHVPADPRQGPGVRVRAQGEIRIAVEMGPDNAAVLGGPIAVDIVGCDLRHAEGLYRRRGGLGAKGRHAQRRQVIGLHVAQILRVLHDRLQEGHPRLEDGHLVALDDRGEPPGMGKNRRPLGHNRGHPCGQGGADHVALAGDPAGIGHHIEDIAGPGVEGGRHGVGDPGHIAAVDMYHALGLSGRTGRVDEEERELRVHGQGRRARPDGADEILIAEGQQIGFARYIEPGASRGGDQGRGGGVGELMAPAVAVRPPGQVRQGDVSHHHDRLDAGRGRHQSFGHRDPCARHGRRVEGP